LQVRNEEIPFEDLESSFHEQRERFILANPEFRKATSPKEIEEDRKMISASLREMLQWLTNRGVMQQGVRLQCTNCGSRFWCEIGTLKQTVHCDGCAANVRVPVESIWRYRLNSLVRNGIALHGCVAVISALRCLRERARDSFIYTHGIALFKDYGSKPEAEIDLLCISNGKLICGEVKSSASEFTQEELTKLAGIAADIKADQVAISAFNDSQNLMEAHGKALSSLLPPDCPVIICRPHQWAFEPDPHP
jgi:hypothetical protein